MKKILGGLAGLMVAVLAGGAAMAQANLPDAQIESNVIRQLATAPELSTQNIQTTTVYGVVTLTGNVHDESMRTTAENLASRALGVKKVVDQMALGDAPPPNGGVDPAQNQDAANGSDPGNDPAAINGNQAPMSEPGPGQVLMSDGTYGPASADQAAPTAYDAQQSQPPAYGNQPPTSASRTVCRAACRDECDGSIWNAFASASEPRVQLEQCSSRDAVHRYRDVRRGGRRGDCDSAGRDSEWDCD
jgi:hypothetical protein